MKKILIAAAGIIGFNAGVQHAPKTTLPPEPGQHTTTPPPEETPAPTTTPVPTTTAPQHIAISTDFGTLYFPEQWNEFLAVEQTPQGDTLILDFVAIIRDGQYPLFTVTIGTSEDTQIGTITDAEGTQRGVYLVMHELEDMSALSEDEQQRLFAMQEDLNYLIENLK